MKKEAKNTPETLFRLWKFLSDFKGKIILVIILNIIATAGSIQYAVLPFMVYL